MKKSKINLLTYKNDYQKVEKYFSHLRVFILILSFILLALVTFFFVYLKQKNQEINNLLGQKSALIEIINRQKENEAKLIFIQKKYQALKDFMKDDANFLPYYNLLNSALSLSTGSAMLEKVQIDKGRNVVFDISFTNIGELTNFLSFIESESFLKQFETLSLKNYSAFNEEASQTESYKLSFEGRFVPLNEHKN